VVNQASSWYGAKCPSRTNAGAETSKSTLPNSSRCSTACSVVIMCGGVAVSPMILGSGSSPTIAA
jgi:hypothetical protein